MTIYRRRTSYAVAASGPTPLVSYNFDDSTAADGTNANGGTLTNGGSGGNALNATIQQCTWRAGFQGRGLEFIPRAAANNTLIDRVLVAANSALNLTTGGTLACWYKNNATTFDQGLLIGLVTGSNEDEIFSLWARGGGNNGNIAVYVLSQSPVGQAGLLGWSFNASSVANIQDWNHYAVTYQSNGASASGVLQIYINGVLRTTLSSANNSIYPRGNFSYTGNLRLICGAPGWGNGPPGNGLNGTLDDVRIYDSALTQAQISAIASA